MRRVLRRLHCPVAPLYYNLIEGYAVQSAVDAQRSSDDQICLGDLKITAMRIALVCSNDDELRDMRSGRDQDRALLLSHRSRQEDRSRSPSNWSSCAWSDWTIPLLSARASQEQSGCISLQQYGSRTVWNDGHAGHHLVGDWRRLHRPDDPLFRPQGAKKGFLGAIGPPNLPPRGRPRNSYN